MCSINIQYAALNLSRVGFTILNSDARARYLAIEIRYACTWIDICNPAGSQPKTIRMWFQADEKRPLGIRIFCMN